MSDKKRQQLIEAGQLNPDGSRKDRPIEFPEGSAVGAADIAAATSEVPT